jgi:TP901 family phage tail tape measure protein
MARFIAGLQGAQANGENVNATLSDLGITGIRESDALLRLSSANDVLVSSLKMGNDEYERGTALAEEAAKRYETAESRIRMAGNALKDAGIEIGATFLPMLANAADAVVSLTEAVDRVPAPVVKVGAALAGVAGTAALLAGGALILIPRLAETGR